MKVVMGQLNTWVGDLQGNTDKVIKVASGVGSHDEPVLLVFPELTLTGYPPEDLLMRDSLHDQIEAALSVWRLNCPQSFTSLLVIRVVRKASYLTRPALSTTARLSVSTSSSGYLTTKCLTKSDTLRKGRTLV